MPLYSHFLVKRGADGQWMPVSRCVELQPYINSYSGIDEDPSQNEDFQNVSYEQPQEPDSEYPTIEKTVHEFVNCPPEPDEEPFDEPTHFAERIFVPDAEYFKCKHKRRAALIGVLTLGTAVVSMVGIGNTWRGNIFAGTSMSEANGGVAFVLKIISFILLLAIMAIPFFVYSFFALIYYSIKMYNLKHR